MTWEMATASGANEMYNLYNKQDKKLLTLTINLFSGAARIECESEKRGFLISKEGTRRPKTVLLNEYGVKIGEIGNENNKNYIDVNDHRFYYAIQNDPLAQLILYKESKDKPFVACKLKTEYSTPSIEFRKEHNLPPFSHPGLLMALCWYMFLPVAKENVAEYAQ